MPWSSDMVGVEGCGVGWEGVAGVCLAVQGQSRWGLVHGAWGTGTIAHCQLCAQVAPLPSELKSRHELIYTRGEREGVHTT